MKNLGIFTVFLFLTIVSDSFSQTASAYYFTRFDPSYKYVYSRNIDGSNESRFTLSERPKPIAVDWSRTPKKLYIGIVPTSGTCKIIRCNLDGSGQEDVVTELANVNDIELDLNNRKIYWLQNTNNDDKIYKADMDGLNSNVQYIYYTTTESRELWGLALDAPNQLLWITERGSNYSASYIRRMTVTGSNITTIKNPAYNPHDIEFYNGKIYWGENDGITKANSDGSSETVIYADADADGLAVDGTNGIVFWVDYLTGEVKRVDIAGGNYAVHSPSHSTIVSIDTDYNPSALPVELSLFEGESRKHGVYLRWLTAIECSNNGFEIERKTVPEGNPKTQSNLSHDWAKIGFVKGAGNSNSPKEYIFIDNTCREYQSDNEFLYRLKQIDNDGSFSYSKEIRIVDKTYYDYNLTANYPNPFNPTTTIEFQIPQPEHVVLKIFDILGNEVAVLIDEMKTEGKFRFEFNARDLKSGIYFYRLQAGNFSEIKKMVIIK